MTERKFTDEDVIKVLECCIKAEAWYDCEKLGCPATFKHGCYFYLQTDEDYENAFYIEILKQALALINRQRAEIEAWETGQKALQKNLSQIIRAEAIKEFAEGLKKRLERKYTIYGREYVLRHLRELVKEMTEGEQ